MQQRPISVMIFGILNIGFGMLGLVSLLVSMVFMSHMNAAGNPILQKMNENPQYVAWTKISFPLGGIASIVVLAAGIGLLLLQNWARIASIGYGIYTILGCLVGSIVMINVFSTIMPHNANGPAGIVMMAPMIGAFFGMALSLVYPILLIIFMTRPKVVAACSPAQPVA